MSEYESAEMITYGSIENETYLTHEQKEKVLEWFAKKLWVLLEEGSGESDYYGKSYDPLEINGNIAHSYVFDLRDGGRQHPFKNLEELEIMLMEYGIKQISALINQAIEE